MLVITRETRPSRSRYVLVIFICWKICLGFCFLSYAILQHRESEKVSLTLRRRDADAAMRAQNYEICEFLPHISALASMERRLDV